MEFVKTRLDGVILMRLDLLRDERGYFTSTYSAAEMRAQGLDMYVAQTAVSYNQTKGTLRGLHFQVAPHAQKKLVRCTRGAIYDVIVDLREGSGTCGQWLGLELSAEGGSMLYVPEGCAHGFLTLEDSTEVSYHLSVDRSAQEERGLRWDDPAIGVEWPFRPCVVSARDQAFPSIEVPRG